MFLQLLYQLTNARNKIQFFSSITLSNTCRELYVIKCVC